MKLFSKLSARRWILLGVVGIAAAVLAAPYLSADAFGDRIRLSLERALHRKVEIEAAHFTLLRGPGFSLQGVVIHENPAVGAEPLAYVNSIQARVSLLGLLRGRLEFAALRLEEPSLNLVKTEAGPWNFQALTGSATGLRFPAVSMRNGRINFTFGGVKSVFYFSQADLDINPPSRPGGEFSVDFRGDPTRSDRNARGFGTLRGRGRWSPSSAPGGNLDLEVTLERTSLGELATLIHGHDIGVHGQAGGRATFRGPLNGLVVDGTLQLTDIHRWDLLPPYAEGGPLRLRGRLDLPDQEVDIETVPTPQSALGVHLRASEYLVRPRWVVGVTLNRFAVSPLAEVARHMGEGLTPDERLDGAVSGAVVYSSEGGIQGSLLLSGVSLGAPGRPAVKVEEARLVLDGDHTRMPPAVITVGEKDQATLSFDYLLSRQQLDLRLDTARMSLAALASSSGPMPGIPKPGFASVFQNGVWQGRLDYHGEGGTPGLWRGALQIADAGVAVDGLAEPVKIASAAVTLRGDRIQVKGIQAAAGGIEFQGDYTFRPEAKRTALIAGRIPRARLADIERLLGSTLRRPRSLLSRTLRPSRADVPEWLAARHAQGWLDIGVLEVAGEAIESVRLDFFWDGPDLDVPRFTARALGGELNGHLSADFRGPEPVVSVAGRLDSTAWRGGRLSGDGLLRVSGAGGGLYRSLRAEGTFRAQSAALAPGAPVPLLAGAWLLSWEKNLPRLQLSDLRLADGDEVLTGQGGSVAGERLEVEVSRGERRVSLGGTLKPLTLARIEGR